jgi:hypothetical protein
VKFVPRYFIVLEGIVNGSVFLISFSIYLSLAYRKVIDFCISVLFPAILPKKVYDF